MSAALPPEWYLEIEGKRSGPFTPDQIEGFLQDREILPRHQVFSPRRPNEKMTAGEFVAAIAHQREADRAKAKAATPPPRRAATPAGGAPPPFHPPHKPRSMDERTGIIQTQVAAASDPTQHLFDALQAVRERQIQAKLMPPSENEWGSLSRKAPARKSQLVLFATVAALLAVTVWGLNRLLERGPSPASEPESLSAQPAAFAPPVQDSARAAPPAKAAAAPAHSAPKSGGLTSLRPAAPPKPQALPVPITRPRDEGNEESDPQDRDSRPIDRDPVAEFERQNGGDGSIQSLIPPQPGIDGEIAPVIPQSDSGQIDPNQQPLE